MRRQDPLGVDKGIHFPPSEDRRSGAFYGNRLRCLSDNAAV